MTPQISLKQLLAGASMLLVAGAASASRDGIEFFEDIRKAYSERGSYADVGEIEIIERIEGVEGSQLHFFETAATRGAGLVWRAMMVSDRGLEDRTVWLTGDSVMIYDSALRQAKPATSVAKAIEEIFGVSAGQALLVPTLLEFGTGSKALDALASYAEVAQSEPCLENRECRWVSAPLEADGRIRLRVDVETLWVYDVEVTMPSGSGSLTVRVSHSESSLHEGRSEAAASFSPPPSTREVEDWDVSEAPSFDPAEFAGAFSEIVTVDVFTITARIVDNAGKPIPEVQPSDLVATIGEREFPVAAVDWQGSPFHPVAEGVKPQPAATDSPRSDPPSLETGDSEDGRMILIFLQNDFEPTRVKGQMKLFPSLLRLVENLGPSDRVAVLSFFSHLKLWHDFTADRDAVRDVLEKAFFPGAKPPPAKSTGYPSLLETFDTEAAAAIPNVVEGLSYVANTLATLPGEKEIVYFGYGLEGGDPATAMRALQAAQATTFVIDTTQADFHTLGAGLQTMAQATGGTYASSLNFAGQAVREIENLLTGRYLVTIDRSAMPDARGKVGLRLKGKPGTILMKPSEFR